MAVRIRRLRCRFTLRTGSRATDRHVAEGAARPQMQYSMPASPNTSEGGLPPSESASGQQSATGANRPVTTQRADPKKVADRVYELMKEEARVARMRRGAN